MVVLTPPTPSPTDSPELRYAFAAKAAGCPRDQAEHFLQAGIVLQPAQLRFAASCRLCDHPDGPTEIGFGGARMGGKSHAMLSVLGADDCIRHPGLKCLLLRKVGTSGRESFEALLPKTIGRLGKYVPSQSMFRVFNGSWIKLGHFQNESDIDKYLGLEYDVIAVEEATTLTSAKRDTIQSCCRSPLGSGWRARMYYSTNPGGVGHGWFKARFIAPFRKGVETTTRFVPSTVDDNNFATTEYRSFLDGLTGWLKRAWRFGDWDIAAGQYFTTFRSDTHVLGSRMPIPEGWRVWLGFDYGWTHFTSCHLMAESDDGIVYVVAEHCERRWLPERNAAGIHAMLKRHAVAPERLAGVHAGEDVFSRKQTGGTIAEDYARITDHPLRMSRANTDRVNGAAEILRRLGDVDAGIEPTMFIFPECGRLIECLPSLEHDPHRPEDVLKVDCDDNGIGGDDSYDSCRYGIMAAKRRRFAITTESI